MYVSHQEPGKAGRQAAFAWFALLRAELAMRCPKLIFVCEEPADSNAAAERLGVVPLRNPFKPEDVLKALQVAGPSGGVVVKQVRHRSRTHLGATVHADVNAYYGPRQTLPHLRAR